jgi:hypothetical protein
MRCSSHALNFFLLPVLVILAAEISEYHGIRMVHGDLCSEDCKHREKKKIQKCSSAMVSFAPIARLEVKTVMRVARVVRVRVVVGGSMISGRGGSSGDDACHHNPNASNKEGGLALTKSLLTD